MALEEYRRKRDFIKTSEPRRGRVRIRELKLSYLIQKHDATRLHYDFRLELDGVLLSWAVTKGPSLNPADKRRPFERKIILFPMAASREPSPTANMAAAR
jgi:bifunctional non-homologous end joining protein LigD